MSTIVYTVITGTVLLLLVLAALILLLEAREQDMVRRVRALTEAESMASAETTRIADATMDLLRKVGDRLRNTALMSPTEIAEFERMLASAGLNPRSAIGAVLGAKVVLPVVLAFLAYLLAVNRDWSGVKLLMCVGASLPVGMLLPNWIMGRLQKQYRQALQMGIPDALDLIVICAEAGLGLETAIERVAVETRLTNRAVSLEFSILDQEMRLLSDRRRALLNFGERAALDMMKRFSATIIQTVEYGTPLGKGLRTLAAELRHERLLRLEEQAARLPSLLVLPMILFILPCLFLILLGPAAIGIVDAFKGMK